MKNPRLSTLDSQFPAFTLVELLIVIGIIAFLTLLATVSYSGVQSRGKDFKRKDDVKNISAALVLFYHDKNYFPSSVSSIAPTYIQTIPTDPTNGNYPYVPTGCSGSQCTGYRIVACLDNPNDNKKDSSTYSSCSKASYSLYNPQ